MVKVGSARRATAVALLTALLLVAPPVPPSPPPPTTALEAVDASDWERAGDWAVTAVEDPYASVAADLTDAGGARVQVRVRADGRRWTGWRPLGAAPEHGPDPGTAEAAAAATTVTDPVWVGRGRDVQVRTDATDPASVRLLAVALRGRVDHAPPGARRGVEAAHALPLWPSIVPRTSWDPRGECRPTGTPRVADGIRRIVVHHTASFPHYTAAAADDIVRTICLQHTGGRGFDDLGYNFLIDAYGTIYQGRAGGILQAVVGAHASGFNHRSVGIALIGDHEEHQVPAAARDSLDRLTAWLVDRYDLDPGAVTPHVSTGGISRYPEGSLVPLPTVIGHRDTAVNTACPGRHLYRYVTGAGDAQAPLVQSLRALDARDAPPATAGPGRAAALEAVRELSRDLGTGPLGRAVGRMIRAAPRAGERRRSGGG